jgi:hypothetical protein
VGVIPVQHATLKSIPMEKVETHLGPDVINYFLTKSTNWFSTNFATLKYASKTYKGKYCLAVSLARSQAMCVDLFVFVSVQI